MPAVSWQDHWLTQGLFRNRAVWLKELDIFKQTTSLLVVSETTNCFKFLEGSIPTPYPFSPSVSTQHLLPRAIARLLFPNTRKKSVWKWTSLGTYRQNILLYLFSYELEKKQHEKKRNVIMSWTTSILAFLGWCLGLIALEFLFHREHWLQAYFFPF